MQLTWLTSGTSPRLLLFFAGWGMDAQPFHNLRFNGYDLAIIYDYTTPTLPDDTSFDSYQEICIVAWSFGVIGAAHFIHAHPHLPVTLRIAVNGTHHQVHDTMGIPTAIFQGTLQALSPASLQKFYRRMCGSTDAFQQFKAHMPQRPIPDLADELRAIAAMPHIDPALTHWDAIYISDHDMIIPTANQHQAWQFHPNVHTIQAAHLPDFKTIITQNLTQKPLVAARFAQATASYDTHATAQHTIATTLAQLWRQHLPHHTTFGDLLEIGAGTGMFTQAYTPFTTISRHQLWDLAYIAPQLPGTHHICDAETAIRHLPDASLDAIVSASTIQWFNSPATFLQQCARTLRPGGIAVLSTFSHLNFHELASIGIPTPAYLTPEAIRSIIPPTLQLIHLSESTHTISFPTTRHLLHHLHLTGVNATSTPSIPATRHLLATHLHTLTYHPLYLLLHRL